MSVGAKFIKLTLDTNLFYSKSPVSFIQQFVTQSKLY